MTFGMMMILMEYYSGQCLVRLYRTECNAWEMQDTLFPKDLLNGCSKCSARDDLKCYFLPFSLLPLITCTSPSFNAHTEPKIVFPLEMGNLTVNLLITHLPTSDNLAAATIVVFEILYESPHPHPTSPFLALKTQATASSHL